MGGGVVGGRSKMAALAAVWARARAADPWEMPGNEYQPNNWKRKKTHGWIKRIRTPSGVAVILRRMLKGRKSLSH